MKSLLCLTLACICLSSKAQTYIGFTSGAMNYEGDLKPNSFTFEQSSFSYSIYARVPLTSHLAWRLAFGGGKLQADDKKNRSYLQARNLNFHSGLLEACTGFEISLLDASRNRIVPYGFLGMAVFHFNPWTYDRNGHRTFLRPLGTEGQGLADYPEKKPYALTQAALSYALGLRCQVEEYLNIGIELNQRKTFTDYIDDVSGFYPDHDKLLSARGTTAADLSYRGNELPGGSPYPHSGEQRGTPGEKDWYYSLSLTAEIQLAQVRQSVGRLLHGNKDWYYKKCPRVF